MREGICELIWIEPTRSAGKPCVYGIVKTNATEGKTLKEICNMDKVLLAKKCNGSLKSIREYKISTGININKLKQGKLVYISYIRAEMGIVILDDMVACSQFFKEPIINKRNTYNVKDIDGILQTSDGYYAVFRCITDSSRIGLKRIEHFNDNISVLGSMTWYDIEEFKRNRYKNVSTGKYFVYKDIIWCN